MDRIHIRDLALRCIIGVNEEERRNRQDIVVSVTLHTDLEPAARSDNFADAVDYRAVKKRIVDLVEDSRYYLIEALAGAIAKLCLEFERVEQVDVVVEKPAALRFARTVAVEITRSRG